MLISTEMGLDFVLFFFFEWEGRASVLSPFYRLGKLRHRKMKWLAQDHPKSQQEVKRSLLRSSPGFWDYCPLGTNLTPWNLHQGSLPSWEPATGQHADLSTNKQPWKTFSGPASSLHGDTWTCMLAFWGQRGEVRYQNIILKVTNSEQGFLHPLRLWGEQKSTVTQQHEVMQHVLCMNLLLLFTDREKTLTLPYKRKRKTTAQKIISLETWHSQLKSQINAG